MTTPTFIPSGFISPFSNDPRVPLHRIFLDTTLKLGREHDCLLTAAAKSPHLI
ncbi:MAG: hypothetical protein ABSG16_22210 [Candidatus Acidiferrum sp.]